MAKRKIGLKTNLVTVGKFCTIETSKYAEHGIKRGNLVYVTGHQTLPYDEKDPYKFQRYFSVTLTKERHVVEDSKHFLVLPYDLKPVKKVAQERLEKLLQEDYATQ